MPILSQSEFEAVISAVIIEVTMMVFAQAGNAILEDARRQMTIAHDALTKGTELTDEMAANLDKAAEVLRTKMSDEKMLDHLWNISDYVELRLGK